jgi:hypothetical protein
MQRNGQVDRILLAQASLDALGRGTYLEIGVNTGTSFIPIRTKRKLGVDPTYILSRRRLFGFAVISFLKIRVERMFCMTSDDFFRTNEALLNRYGIDVCLVDGLHTYEQALRDVYNVLRYLQPKGVILVHDCNPTTELMARPATAIKDLIDEGIQGWDGAWSGDVWKALVHLRALRNDVSAFVLDCDTGIGVVTKGLRRDSVSCTEADIRAMGYTALCGDRKALLGLRPSEYFEEFLRSHLRSVDARG